MTDFSTGEEEVKVSTMPLSASSHSLQQGQQPPSLHTTVAWQQNWEERIRLWGACMGNRIFAWFLSEFAFNVYTQKSQYNRSSCLQLVCYLIVAEVFLH